MTNPENCSALPSGADADYPEYWRNRPLDKVLDAEIAVQVVGRRCVYLNDHRIAGGKPYYTENLPNHRFSTTVRDALAAFSDDILRAALREREQSKDYFERWRSAAALRAGGQTGAG